MSVEVGGTLKRIHDTLEKRANEDLRALGITLAQANVLGLLHQSPNETMSQKQIEQALGVSHPTIVGILQRLEQKGLIACSPDPDDRRQKLVQLGGQYAVQFGYLAEHKRVMIECMLAGFSAAERTQLGEMLLRIHQNLQNTPTAKPPAEHSVVAASDALKPTGTVSWSDQQSR